MKISILTPSFNSGKYLARAIQSVAKQDYSNWEHIVVDGGSTDNTIDILKHSPGVQWVSEQDRGQSDAMNKAFLRSKGDVIVYLNADDELHDGHFSFITQEFFKHSDVDMIVLDLTINNQGKVSKRSASTKLRTILNYWPARFPLNPVAYAYRRSLQTKVGPFPLDNHYSMDYWFLLRAYLHGKVIKRNFVGGVYHIDGTNKSADAIRARSSLKMVRNNFLAQHWTRSKVLSFVLLRPAYYFLDVYGKARSRAKTRLNNPEMSKESR